MNSVFNRYPFIPNTSTAVVTNQYMETKFYTIDNMAILKDYNEADCT